MRINQGTISRFKFDLLNYKIDVLYSRRFKGIKIKNTEKREEYAKACEIWKMEYFVIKLIFTNIKKLRKNSQKRKSSAFRTTSSRKHATEDQLTRCFHIFRCIRYCYLPVKTR